MGPGDGAPGLAGWTIAGYDILDEIGAGGMGVVYKARHSRLERLVALKFLPPDQAADESRRRRFLQEARAASALNHPGIVTLHDIVTHEGADVLVMELIEGESLARRIPTGGLPWRQAVGLLLELSEAMAVAHDAGIVHRDLKPANVMVTSDGRVKVLDFGIAKLMPNLGAPEVDLTLTGITEAGSQPGTPTYMAPEQLLGEPVDHRADIFSFGILTYEVLTGRRPFHGPSPVALVDEILHGDPQPVHVLRPQIPVALAALVERALAKQPAKRQQSMREISAELCTLMSPSHATDGIEITGGATLKTVTLKTVTLKTLVASDLVESTLLETSSDENHGSADLDRLLREQVNEHRGQEVRSESGRLLLFELPWDAVRFALAFHHTMALRTQEMATELETRVGIHLGEVTAVRVPRPDVDLKDGDRGDSEQGVWTFEVDLESQSTAARLLALAGPRQTLLSHAAFDLARRGAERQDTVVTDQLGWLAHGDYLFAGTEAISNEALEIFEVGAQGFAPLRPPVAAAEVSRSPNQSKILGWRPAPGLTVPLRPNWLLEKKLGAGGFGEVWLAGHAKIHELRVFKFCYEAERLRSLQREITVFRLLKEELGERDDIARLIDWNLEEAPYFIESAYTAGGSLMDWSAARGGIAKIDLGERLELVAQVATALEAAHSAGVLHKDIKPANVLISEGPDGRPRALLTDFGIGLITDRERLRARGITVLGLTEETTGDSSGTPGTHLYMAPELLTGCGPTIQSDIYALGVMLYQIAVGDLDRPLATGWERDIGDELLRQDIAEFADGARQHRPRSALDVAERLRTLEQRRQQRQAEEETRKARARGRRRRHLAAGAAAVTSVMLLIISGFAYQTFQAKNRELEARENAEQRRRQAEKIIDFMLGDLRRDLEPIGKLDLLDQVGDRAMAYFAAVPEDDLSSAEMRSYATALHQIGQVRFALGRAAEAEAAFGRSLALAKSLAARDPIHTGWQFELGQSHFWLGYLHWNERQLAAAREQFEAYREISEALVAHDPENADWQLELAYSHSNLASVLEQRGELDKAAAELELSAKTLERLSAGQSAGHSLEIELAHIYAKLGKVLEKQGEFNGALARYQTHLDLIQRAHEASPDSVEPLRRLGFAHDHLGDLLWLRGDLAGALDHYLADLEIATRVTGRDPKNLLWREELALVHSKVARARLFGGDDEQARRHLEAERKIVQALIEESADLDRWRFAQAIHLLWHGELLVRAGQANAAIPELQTCRTTFETLTREAEGDSYGRLLARTLWLLGEAHVQTGDPAAAQQAWREGVAKSENLIAKERGPRLLDLRIRLLLSLEQLDEAQPLIDELAAIGYREPSYLDFLEHRGLPASERPLVQPISSLH